MLEFLFFVLLILGVVCLYLVLRCLCRVLLRLLHTLEAVVELCGYVVLSAFLVVIAAIIGWTVTYTMVGVC